MQRNKINGSAAREIHIDRNKTIEMLQNEFNAIFTFLKIEFFREPCIKGKTTSKDKRIGPDVKLNDILNLKHFGRMLFTDTTTVSELEDGFRKKFGLCVQVFRKSGNVWLETSATDNWTLLQQNEEGKSLHEHLNVAK